MPRTAPLKFRAEFRKNTVTLLLTIWKDEAQVEIAAAVPSGPTAIEWVHVAGCRIAGTNPWSALAINGELPASRIGALSEALSVLALLVKGSLEELPDRAAQLLGSAR